ncbi:T6SS immunity protein Tli4 family protein [Neisseriaceae bacterium TC5R-5]|nr:T6SS immunity protein Tli4 family protein [Neisseriaceae bacterium TC5R-5]
MPDLSLRLQRLFAQTKMVCFGRYVLEVPAEAVLLWGAQQVPVPITLYRHAADQLSAYAQAYREQQLGLSKSAEIAYFGAGVLPGSWEVLAYRDHIAKQHGGVSACTFMALTPHLFAWRGKQQIAPLLKQLRVRQPDEVPSEAGVCIDHGFIAELSGQFQEVIEAGIHLPSYPDLSFSVSSNKAASIEDEDGESLLSRIAMQKELLGSDYPALAVLREGARQVFVWPGEESLVTHADGSHDFTWENSERRQNTLYPTLDAQLYSKVAANRVGAAPQASLSDAEMLALWDKLLGSLRFRVDAPPTQTTQKPLLPSTSPASHSGLWQPELPPGHPKTAFVSRTPALRLSQGQRLPTLGLLPGEERDVRWRWIGG